MQSKNNRISITSKIMPDLCISLKIIDNYVIIFTNERKSIMNFLKIILTLSFSVSAFSITGKVISWDSVAIKDATVKLLKAGIQTTTDANGQFILTDVVNNLSNTQHNLTVPQLIKSVLNFSVTDKNVLVKIELFSLQGKKISTILKQQLNSGVYNIPITAKNLSTNFNIIRLSIGNKTFSFRQTLQSNSGQIVVTKQFKSLGKIQSNFDDTLIVIKEGYDTLKLNVSSSDEVFTVILYEKTVVKSTTKVVSDNLNQNLLYIDSVTLSFTNNDTIASYKIGDVLVSGPTTKASNGYLRKITAINVNGLQKIAANQITFTTQNATLEDIFTTAHICFNKKLSDSDIIGIDTTNSDSGDTTEPDTTNDSIEHHSSLQKKKLNLGSFSFEITKNLWKNGTDCVDFVGSNVIEPSIYFDVNIHNSKVNRISLTLVMENTTSLKLIASGTFTLSKEIKIKTIELAPFNIPVCGIPVFFATQRIVVLLGVNGSFKSSLEVNATNKFTSTSALIWSNQWQPYSAFINNFSYVKPILKNQLQVEPYFKLQYEFNPYGLKQNKMNIVAKLSLLANTSIQQSSIAILDTLIWKLQFGGAISGEVELTDAFSHSIFSYKNNFFTKYWPITNGKCLMPSFIFTPTTGHAPLTVQFTAASPYHVNNWDWNFGDGSTSNIQNPSHIYNDSNGYEITLKISNDSTSDLITKQIVIIDKINTQSISLSKKNIVDINENRKKNINH